MSERRWYWCSKCGRVYEIPASLAYWSCPEPGCDGTKLDAWEGSVKQLPDGRVSVLFVNCRGWKAVAVGRAAGW